MWKLKTHNAIIHTWRMYHTGTMRYSIISRDPPRIQYDCDVGLIGEWIVCGGFVDGEDIMIGPL